MTNDHIVTRDEAIDMLKLTIGWIQAGKSDVATGQLWFLIDQLEIAMALDERALFMEAYGSNFVNL